MLTSFLRSLPRLGRRWTPLNFTNLNFIRIPTSQAIEEETIPGYVAGRYYPTRIGEILKDRYQVVGKLGFGASSTVWLARDMDYHRYVTLKIFIKSTSMGQQLDDELKIYKRIEEAPRKHRGQCKIIHTDIKADNIMFGIDDDSVFSDFENNELQDPCPRKELDGRIIYTSRELRMPKILGAPILCDFGSAVMGDEQHSEDIQPDIYRAPEVILQVPWSYSVDIWNVGCVIWNLYEGVGEHIPLEQRETSLEGEEKEMFLRLVRKMLQWEPEKRSSAVELEQDEWVQAELHK
ncbi:hypothetical protein PITC_087020 [Penicillium italicum]|uniref:Protein kinase domain-containing protein n=1 Tax=Penicillium italicum TaxID=40296 RepID=A0A0A2KBF7_PENIT|nr:hypothetical protein PITC_087020 [Penicillium italicum]